MRAWQALPQWQPNARFRTWLSRIANNAALDVLRRRATVKVEPAVLGTRGKPRSKSRQTKTPQRQRPLRR